MPAATSKAGMPTCRTPRNFIPAIEDDENPGGYDNRSEGEATQRSPVARW